MKTRNTVVVVAGLLIALALVCAGAAYVVDRWVAAPRDEALCSIVSSQAAVVNQLADDLASSGQPISPDMRTALADLRVARKACN